MKKILRVFLALFCVCVSGLCHAAAPYIQLANTSTAQSVFVISSCIVNSGNYYNPVTNSSGAASFADGGLSSNPSNPYAYYIGYGESLYWSVPSGTSNCFIQIPAVNMYLYFDSKGAVQDGSYSASSKSIIYLFQYPTSSQTLTSTKIKTLPSNYQITYQSGSPSSTIPVLIKIQYKLGVANNVCGWTNTPYSSFLCASGLGCLCNGHNCNCESNGLGATCGTGNTPYNGFACSSGNSCSCNGTTCTCQASSGAQGTTCGTGYTPYTNFSCATNLTCSCNGISCTCASSGAAGSTCGANNTPYTGFSCASGTSCYCDGASCTCQDNGIGATCGTGTPAKGFSCVDPYSPNKASCYCTTQSCKCAYTQKATAGATCGNDGMPYTNFSCPSNAPCYCIKNSCSCRENTSGSSCGTSATGMWSNFCASGLTCTLNGKTSTYQCQ